MHTRIIKDESDGEAIVDLLQNDWTNPFGKDTSDLISISTGAAAKPEVSIDLLHALQKGEEAYETFHEERLKEGKGFYDTIKKISLKRMGEAKTKIVKGTSKEVILKADRRFFGIMVLIAKNRKLNMQDVFFHPLGSLPWSLANVDGTVMVWPSYRNYMVKIAPLQSSLITFSSHHCMLLKEVIVLM